MIDGVKTKKLAVHPDERGRLMEILRRDDKVFERFGQVYATTTYPGVVKAWHKHEKQADNLACVAGMLKVALYDPRADSPTRGQVSELVIGVHNPTLLHIPPGVWHGWKCVGAEEAVVVNVPTEPYDAAHPDEQRRPAHDPEIPYDWSRKDG